MNSRKENLKRLELLISIVPHGKKAIIIDLLEDFQVNMSLSTHGFGASTNEIKEVLGLDDNNCDIVFSFIRSDQSKDAILSLEDKFKKFKDNHSAAFVVPLDKMIGVQNYLFLANLGGKYIGK